MVTIKKEDGVFIFELKGMHKLWALKSQLSIPVEHVLKAHQNRESIKGWPGWKAPGTFIPSIITAGAF